MEPRPDESCLERCTARQLADVAVLSADWVGAPPLQVAEGLADLLLKTLRLDFAYLRLRLGQINGHELEVARTIHQPTTEAQTREIGRALAPWVDRAGTNEAQSVTNPVGSGIVRVIVVPVGRDAEEGLLVAGSQQAGFPGEDDRLLLEVAANQAATALKYRRAEEARSQLLRERDELLGAWHCRSSPCPSLASYSTRRTTLSTGILRRRRSSAIGEKTSWGRTATCWSRPRAASTHGRSSVAWPPAK